MLPGQHRVNNKWAPAVSTLGRWRWKIPEALEPTSIDKRLTTRNRLKLKARPNTGGVLRPALACCDKCESTLVYMNTNVHTQERERDGGWPSSELYPLMVLLFQTIIVLATVYDHQILLQQGQGCGRVSRVFAQHVWSPGFSAQHHVNWVWWCTPSALRGQQ